jgi:hypothetical protein
LLIASMYDIINLLRTNDTEVNYASKYILH